MAPPSDSPVPSTMNLALRVDALEESDRKNVCDHFSIRDEARASSDRAAEVSKSNGTEIKKVADGIKRIAGTLEKTLTEVSLLRQDVIKWQGDTAQLQGAVTGLKAQVDGVEKGTRDRIDSVHDEVEEVKTGQHRTFAAIVHDASKTADELETQRKELKKLRVRYAFRLTTLVTVTITTWEVLKWLGPIVAKVFH